MSFTTAPLSFSVPACGGGGGKKPLAVARWYAIRIELLLAQNCITGHLEFRLDTFFVFVDPRWSPLEETTRPPGDGEVRTASEHVIAPCCATYLGSLLG